VIGTLSAKLRIMLIAASGSDDFEKPALPKLFAIAEMRGKRLKSSRR
jgi:hypothetical protein